MRSYDKDGTKHYIHELQIPNYGGKIWVINPRSGEMDTIGDNNDQSTRGTSAGHIDDEIPF